MSKKDVLSAQVITVIDDYTVVISIGSDHSVYEGQKFLVYSLSDEDLIDPVTKENLGRLEIIVGTGITKHIQPKITTIETLTHTKYKKKRIIKSSPFGGILHGGDQIIEEPVSTRDSFENPKRGDFVKAIS